MAKAGILIVEDSFIVAFHLQTILEGEGYRVVGKCDTAEEAIRFTEANRPDLVLMDIMLNGDMDGIQAAAILKTKYNVPIIYITGLTDKSTINRAKITEPYGYLSKPFEAAQVFTVIEMALYKHDIESRLKRSEEKYFSTVNCISDAVLAIDRNFYVTYMNPSAEEITKWPQAEALGRPVADVLNLVNETTKDLKVNPVQCVIGMGNRNRMPDDLMLVNKHGGKTPIGESSLSSLLDNQGHLIGLIIVFKDMTEKREHENLIREMERSRLAALIEGQEKERARIAKDLHDGLGQMLNAIKMNARMTITDKVAADSMSKLLDEAIQESVRISENLLPAKLKDFDLSVCLRTLCNNIEKSTQSTISFNAHGNAFKMGQSQKVNFYRIAQEAVNNAIKHAQAHTITVQLYEGSRTVRLSIEDNGRGLVKNKSLSLQGQNGLINIRDRAEIMGGKFTIESDNQRGTILIVEVPTDKLMIHE